MQLQFECGDESSRTDVGAQQCLDASRDAVVALDADGRIVVWSAGAQRMYGWRPEEMLGRQLPWPTADGRAVEHRQLHDLARDGVVVGAVEVATPRRGGSVTVVEVSTDAVRDGSGAVIGTCAIHRDVTGRASAPVLPTSAGPDVDRSVGGAGPDAALCFDVLCREYRLDVLERDLVALLLTGHRIPEMARALHRSPGTIRNRLSLLYRKFGVGGQIELLDRLHGRLGRVTPIGGDGHDGPFAPARRMTDESDLGPYGRDAQWADDGRGGRTTVA